MSISVSQTARQRAIDAARDVLSLNPVYLDTETTGLNATDEIVEISIVDQDGAVLLETLVKPSRPIPAEATVIHGITNEDVQSSRAWPIVWTLAKPLITGRVVVIYNDDFDLRMMRQSYERYNMKWNERIKTFDLLKLYAEYRGERDPRRGGYRYHSLASAGKQCGIALPNAHRATADTLLARALMLHIAGQTL
jgi:DNA polymerase-3 subunit epsilon